MMYNITKDKKLKGDPIYLEDLKVSIHQPNLGEIIDFGEARFFNAMGLLFSEEKFIRDRLMEIAEMNESHGFKEYLQNATFYELLILALATESKQVKDTFFGFLELMIKDCKIVSKDNENYDVTVKKKGYQITNELIIEIRNICQELFNWNKLMDEAISEFNPGNKLAEKIMEKIQKARDRKAKISGDPQKTSSLIYSYISILSVAMNQVDIDPFMKITFFRLLDLMNRFIAKTQSDQEVAAATAGAKVEITGWFQDV